MSLLVMCQTISWPGTVAFQRVCWLPGNLVRTKLKAVTVICSSNSQQERVFISKMSNYSFNTKPDRCFFEKFVFFSCIFL